MWCLRVHSDISVLDSLDIELLKADSTEHIASDAGCVWKEAMVGECSWGVCLNRAANDGRTAAIRLLAIRLCGPANACPGCKEITKDWSTMQGESEALKFLSKCWRSRMSDFAHRAAAIPRSMAMRVSKSGRWSGLKHRMRLAADAAWKVCTFCLVLQSVHLRS